MYKGIMLSHITLNCFFYYWLFLQRDKWERPPEVFQTVIFNCWNHYLHNLKKFFSIHSLMHINIIKEAFNAYPHNDAIQNTVWATALSTLGSFCDNLFLNQPPDFMNTVNHNCQGCHWQEIATEPCQSSSEVKTPEIKKMAWKCVFWDLRGASHILRNSELNVRKCKLHNFSERFPTRCFCTASYSDPTISKQPQPFPREPKFSSVLRCISLCTLCFFPCHQTLCTSA